MLAIFNRYFGTFESRNHSEVCAVGWEPNPTHTDHLRALETAYNNCGWRVTINTNTGVGARNTRAKARLITKGRFQLIIKKTN